MLADARFPAGGHAHSGGLEGAVTAGAVTDVRSLELFIRGRLATAGMVAAGLAAAACAHSGQEHPGPAHSPAGVWAWLDAEADARTPSPAQREASRRQGRALLRAAVAAWPAPWLDDLAGARPPPHHAIAVGAVAAAAGSGPPEAALVAAYLAVTGPASAAIRLLSLNPIEVAAMIARLGGAIEAAAERSAAALAAPEGSEGGTVFFDDLPFPSAPALDLLAEAHVRTEVRLFAS
jgi:urease accessory protein